MNSMADESQQQQPCRMKLRHLPTMLVWLSLVGALLRESSSNSINNQNVNKRSKTDWGVLVSAATAATSVAAGTLEHRSGRAFHKSSSSLPIEEDDGLVISEEGAVEVMDDMHDHFRHRQQQESDDDESLGTKNNVPEVIVVFAVDGSVVGISKATGEVLWKQSESAIASSSTTPSSSSFSTLKVNNSQKKLNENSNIVDATDILRPLVSTTTTTKSASTASYAVVPSIDGTVFTTSNDMTVSTSVKELVARSPFLDPRGRFFVGSRRTTAASLDVETGEILRVVSIESRANNKDEDDIPSLDGRNVIWIGRLDHTVSVQDARTGIMEAQFSVAEVMSVADMHGMVRKEAWSSERLKTRRSKQSAALTALDDEEIIFDTSILASTGLPAIAHNHEVTGTLVATPNGNVAYYDVQTDRISWVTNESLESPVAYAMDARTGAQIGVDIIPDVIDPNGDNDYLRREIERQLITSTIDDIPDGQTIVGAMSNGQLYALPLGLKAASLVSSGTVASTSISSTSSAAALASSSFNNARYSSHVSQLPGRPSANFHDSRQQHHREHDKNHNQLQPHVDYHSSGKHALLTGKKPCTASSPTFPACLIPHHSRSKLPSEVALPLGADTPMYGHEQYLKSDGAVALMTSKYHKEDGGFYHPDFGYVSSEDLYRFQQRAQSKSYKKVIWLLTSWLPPTIICIFVASFELGRRKRLRDEKQQKQNVQIKTEQSNEKGLGSGANETALSQKLSPSQQNHVISVSDEVLGYGGHGTVVYKGTLDGREVAVKRMLKAYHASADREISLLIESDGDPNVVRYFLKEVRGDFVYLALELCDLSLHDLIGVLRENQQQRIGPSSEEKTDERRICDSKILQSTNRILLQIASGVKHLHSLRIVHR
jgi:hypothetical protein